MKSNGGKSILYIWKYLVFRPYAISQMTSVYTREYQHL